MTFELQLGFSHIGLGSESHSSGENRVGLLKACELINCPSACGARQPYVDTSCRDRTIARGLPRN